MTIINVADVAVGKHLSEASVEPFFATRWLHLIQESVPRMLDLSRTILSFPAVTNYSFPFF
jgi:hypothetical protein